MVRKLKLVFVLLSLALLGLLVFFNGYIKMDMREELLLSDIAKVQLKNRIALIKDVCGELCNTSRKGTRGHFFDHIKANVNCNALFNSEYMDEPHGNRHAPREIPADILGEFTMGHRIPVRYKYFDQKYFGKNAETAVWTKDLIDNWVSLAHQGSLIGNYGINETNALRDGLKHATGIVNGRILVIGSENPWVESCCLEAGAKEVVTLEYGRILSLHLKVKTVTPSEFRFLYLNNSLGKFDAVVTFSSVEHSGLGRYGDALNPWGDLIAIARGWCVTKNGGSLIIGVPYDYLHEHIDFNAHRFYGKIRYPYLCTNWRQHYMGIGSQRVHVFIK